jgi:genome maintenance exonuclease 1
MVFQAMVVNPELSEKEALAKPWAESKKAMERGTEVHKMVENWKPGMDPLKMIGVKYKGYARAFKQWLKENSPEIIEHERSVLCKEHYYAGTLDMLAKLNGEDETYIIDIKTGKDIYDDYFLQLSAYQYALMEEGQNVEHIGVLLLLPDGNYKFALGEPRIDVFLAAKRLWEWKNREKLEKYGYKFSA